MEHQRIRAAEALCSVGYICKIPLHHRYLVLFNMSDIQAKVNSRLTQVSDFLTGNKTATTIPFDPNCTKFPSRKDVPRREDAPEGAYVTIELPRNLADVQKCLGLGNR